MDSSCEDDIMESQSRKGKVYEEFVHKFLKGTIVSGFQDYYDIENKRCVYEVKGARVYHTDQKGRARIGRYQIIVDNHKKFKELADAANKEPKYVFVLSIGGRKVFKTMSWEIVGKMMICEGKLTKRTDDKEVCHINLKSIW